VTKSATDKGVIRPLRDEVTTAPLITHSTLYSSLYRTRVF